MNATRKSLLLAAAAAALAIGVPSANAADCASPKGIAERGACAAAAQGVEPLRRFVDRTRMLYGLSIHDFAKAVPQSAQAKGDDAVRVAQADK